MNTDTTALAQPETLKADRGQSATPITLVESDGFAAWLKALPAGSRAAAQAQGFKGGAGEHAILADGDGWQVAVGVSDATALGTWSLAKLAEVLPAGTYRLSGDAPTGLDKALFGWAAAQYRFDRYRADRSGEGPRVLLTKAVKAIEPALREAIATTWVRDLVNTPTEDMGPADLEREFLFLAREFKLHARVTVGEALADGFPLIHAVGRAAARERAPRLLELEWGDPAHPRVALVGKGVCFDTGGLDLKPSAGMLLMKKDMGGAAHAMALARLVMEAGLKVRLHLLVPTVENAVSGNAMRPGDVFPSRAGLTVEVTNTDAEGRLILADALARAAEDEPELVIDFATLTGAARVALGPDLPALMARRDETAQGLLDAGLACDDPCWRLPLPDAYREYLKSDVADLQNSPSNGFAGSSVAGLFLDRFVPEGVDWAHFDTFAWRPAGKPGRPKGGEALGLRAAWGLLRARYGG